MVSTFSKLRSPKWKTNQSQWNDVRCLLGNVCKQIITYYYYSCKLSKSKHTVTMNIKSIQFLIFYIPFLKIDQGSSHFLEPILYKYILFGKSLLTWTKTNGDKHSQSNSEDYLWKNIDLNGTKYFTDPEIKRDDSTSPKSLQSTWLSHARQRKQPRMSMKRSKRFVVGSLLNKLKKQRKYKL